MVPNPYRAVRCPLVLAVMALCLGTAPARAADEPFRLSARFGFQVDRLHSVVADSLGLSVTRSTVAAIDYDFRIFSVPMAGSDKPAFHLVGDVMMGKRALPLQDFAAPGFLGAPIQEVPVAEVLTGFLLRVPMTVVDPGAGSALHLGYRGGLVLASGDAEQNDFPKVKQFMFGFERTRGFFAGSMVEMAYGTNESAGRAFGAHRWDAKVLVVGQIGASSGAAPAKAPVGRAPAARAEGSPLQLFIELNVDTDGSIGPDLFMARGGLAFDAGRVLSRVLGSGK
ncbi:MAG: hypothetical protein ABL977_15705 [Candidatus Eisenbacteria bacterium]